MPPGLHKLQSSTVHELSHHAMPPFHDPKLHWLREGLAVMVEHSLYPEAESQRSPAEGWLEAVRNSQTGLNCSIELHHSTYPLQYRIAPVVLEQWHAMRTHLGAEPWYDIRTLLSAVDRDTTAADVHDAIDATLPGFAADYLEPGPDCPGVPLLALRDVHLQHQATYGDADNPAAWLGATGFIQVEQVQDELYGWRRFHHVPFAMRCHPRDGIPADGTSLQLCDSGTEPWEPVTRILALENQVDKASFAAVSGSASLPMPTQVDFIQADGLIPNQPPQTSQRLGWCGSTQEDAWDIDGDGDGYPLASDCDDQDPAVHPGAVELGGGFGWSTDDDCNCYALAPTLPIAAAEWQPTGPHCVSGDSP